MPWSDREVTIKFNKERFFCFIIFFIAMLCIIVDHVLKPVEQYTWWVGLILISVLSGYMMPGKR